MKRKEKVTSCRSRLKNNSILRTLNKSHPIFVIFTIPGNRLIPILFGKEKRNRGGELRKFQKYFTN